MAVVTPQPMGSLHVLMESGDQVFLDARMVGMSSDAASGMLLEGVAVGEHELSIVTPGGQRTSFKVNIYDGQTTTITLSSLGLRGGRRRGEDSTVELQAPVTQSSRCELNVGSAQLAGAKEDLRIEHLSPGRYHVSVTCGSRAAGADIDVPPGMVVTVAADFVAGKLKVADQRPRITNMAVASPADAIMRFDLPLSWKRAMVAALVPGIHAESATMARGYMAIVTFNAPTRTAMYAYMSRLRTMDGVSGTNYDGFVETSDGVRARLSIQFRPDQQ